MQTGLVLRPIALGAAVVAIAACSQGFEPGVPLTGRWGGKDLMADLTPAGGTLELTCGAGELDGPLVPDNNGHVTASGYTIFVGGAQPPVGYVAPRTRVVISGRVDGAKLTLGVWKVLIISTEASQQYTLVRGSNGQVLLCP